MKKLLCVLLSVILILSGCSFVNGNSDSQKALGSTNLVGSTDGARNTGGFFAAQGDWLFFANFNDGGCLYAEKSNGKKQIKLTDFPVANINVVGDTLAFTDMTHCEYFQNGEYITAVGADYKAIFNEVTQPGQVSFGGSLYIIYNPITDKEPKLSVIRADDNVYYENIVLTPTTLAVTAVEYKKDRSDVTTLSAGNEGFQVQTMELSHFNTPTVQLLNNEETDYFGNPLPTMRQPVAMDPNKLDPWKQYMPPIENAKIIGTPKWAGDNIYVTVVTDEFLKDPNSGEMTENPQGGISYIYKYDINKGEFISYAEGSSVAVNGKGEAFFLDPEGNVYRYETSKDGSGSHQLAHGIQGKYLIDSDDENILIRYQNHDGTWLEGKIETNEDSPGEYFATPKYFGNDEKYMFWSWYIHGKRYLYDYSSNILWEDDGDALRAVQGNPDAKHKLPAYKITEKPPIIVGELPLNENPPIIFDNAPPVVEKEESSSSKPAVTEKDPPKEEKPAAPDKSSQNNIKVTRYEGDYVTVTEDYDRKTVARLNAKDGIDYNLKNNPPGKVFLETGTDSLGVFVINDKLHVTMYGTGMLYAFVDGDANKFHLVGSTALFSADEEVTVQVDDMFIVKGTGLFLVHKGIDEGMLKLYNGSLDLYNLDGNHLESFENGTECFVRPEGPSGEWSISGSKPINYKKSATIFEKVMDEDFVTKHLN